MPYIPILLLLFFLSFSYDFLGHKRGYNLGYYFIYLLLVVVSGFRYRIRSENFAYICISKMTKTNKNKK